MVQVAVLVGNCRWNLRCPSPDIPFFLFKLAAEYRMLKSTSMLLLFLAACLTGCDWLGNSRLTIRPNEAFSDPKQIALATAAEEGSIRAIDKAIESGAAVKAIGKRGATALWYALAAQEKKAFAHLLRLGADPNTVNDQGSPLISWCVTAPDIEYLKLALAHGGDPHARNANNGRPIFFDALSDDDAAQKIELLLTAGADINIRARDGSTALGFTPWLDSKLLLLERGADPFIRNDLDMDLAAGLFPPFADEKSEIRTKILKLLEAKGVKFDGAAIAKAKIGNLGEATGKEPPMWLKSNLKEPNPDWVKANPQKAEQWYQAVLRRPAPKY